ncbi:MAG: polyprenyl synthetase family protein [Candidatus Cloacimonadota bacterium]|nr:MAG: polyprenyl synthetase family protein [Candidatus Cloacimonadota bacterium]RLC58734.1 MAG: polyprenyl synthetase family protein [Candidatus Cloacimonadota bacterium]
MSANKMLLKKDLKEKRELVNIEVDRFLPRKDEYPKQIHKAMRHTLFAGGKRMRPYLLINTFLLFRDEIKKTLLVAGAIEMLHSYTLIHDDLPEIDNDEYRRGKKACHVLFGSDIALLAGDALLVNAFEAITATELDEKLKLVLIRELAEEAGHLGLIAGQMVDINSEGKKISKETLDYIHKNKTARMINLPIRFGCYLADAPEADLKRLEKFGNKLGLAFQIVDDILDVEGDQQTLGKTIGKDSKAHKATFPALYGLEESKKMAEKLIDDAKNLLKPYGEKAETLLLLCDFVLTRKF